MRGKLGRLFVMAILSLVVIGFYSTSKIVFAKGGTTSASGWEKHDNGNGKCEHGKKFKCNKCKKRCVLLQKKTPGKQQKGNINISGTVKAAKFVGDGSMLTGINGSGGDGDNGWIVFGSVISFDGTVAARAFSGTSPFIIEAPTDIERMRVTESGNVGIGTMNPTNKLDVAGGVTVGAGYSETSVVPTNGMIIEGPVGIGTTGPDEKLHVVGDVKVDGSIQISTTTRTLAIPPGAFVPASNSFAYAVDNFASFHNIRGTTAGQAVSLFAPVHLPGGATITEFTAFIRDSATQNITVLMSNYNPTTGATGSITGALTSSGTPGRSTLSTTPIGFNPVDNANRVQFVKASWTVPTTPTDIQLEGVFIEYTITSPLP